MVFRASRARKDSSLVLKAEKLRAVSHKVVSHRKVVSNRRVERNRKAAKLRVVKAKALRVVKVKDLRADKVKDLRMAKIRDPRIVRTRDLKMAKIRDLRTVKTRDLRMVKTRDLKAVRNPRTVSLRNSALKRAVRANHSVVKVRTLSAPRVAMDKALRAARDPRVVKEKVRVLRAARAKVENSNRKVASSRRVVKARDLRMDKARALRVGKARALRVAKVASVEKANSLLMNSNLHISLNNMIRDLDLDLASISLFYLSKRPQRS